MKPTTLPETPTTLTANPINGQASVRPQLVMRHAYQEAANTTVA